MRLGLLAMVVLAASTLYVHSAGLTPYPLTTCIVTGDKLDKDAIVFAYDGRELKTCCTNCVDDFYKDPAGYVTKMEEEVEKLAQK